ncbi:hypothetical protein RhiirA4_462427 [Rhizophagus irregularis]|uniref:Uncharacterized protein n=1 Tax=Rhizophagus irregularis TaxID=588596 RepID=A0A2I1GKY6_9GLOM|nr:hypothetical protein RhiirA4_462427 [Rhizophagus irregularis]
MEVGDADDSNEQDSKNEVLPTVESFKDRKLVQWVIMNQQSFTIVEEPSFIEFVHSLHPSTLVPSADIIKRNICNLYAFTTDIWTSPSAKSFLSLRSVIVDFIQMYGSYTGENIKNTFILELENLCTRILKYLDQELSLSQLRQLFNKIRVSTQRCEMISRALLIKLALVISKAIHLQKNNGMDLER